MDEEHRTQVDLLSEQEKLRDRECIDALKIISRKPDILSNSYDQIRQQVREEILGNDASGGIIAQYDALGLPFLPDNSHGVPNGITVIPNEFSQPAHCKSAREIALEPAVPLSELLMNNLRGRATSAYAVTIHELTHTTNVHRRTGKGTIAPLPAGRAVKEFGKQLAKIPLSQVEEFALGTTIEAHSVLCEEWLMGNLRTEADIQDLVRKTFRHPHVFAIGWHDRHSASINYNSLTDPAILTTFLSQIEETGTVPVDPKFDALRIPYEATQSAFKNYFRMIGIGMNVEEIGLYLSLTGASQLSEGLYGGVFVRMEKDIIAIAKKRKLIDQKAEGPDALSKIDALLPSVKERIMRECRNFTDAVTKATISSVTSDSSSK